ncbi:aminobenzoyl-glutamate utilization protein B [Rhizobiales bacterium GAS113]|nr:aminobenzoyl-glutamate utilization protein B [Rhizobiales bacterium GAS113]SEC57418.1 aminobenzoyl-glutamate utilization protein B [Rhizobiales bacterium GAS188]
MRNSEDVWRLVEAKEPLFADLSDRVWATPELNYQEQRSAAAHAAMLEQQGFKVTTGIAGIPTAMIGEAGEGGPVIAIMGEFDALPGLSQAAGIAEQRPLQQNGNGHGCGHNMLGSASLLAASAVKDWLAAQGVKGRVRYYGCPAEEGGSGKGFMVRAGAFDDVDVAICWHPSSFTGVNRAYSLACVEIEFHFSGRASHAAAAPHLGRSALDAVELMNVGVNYMREHMPSSARVHYALIDGGGVAPNVVQAQATVRYLIRAETLGEMWVLVERVRKIAEGAALMTETQMRSVQLSGDANLVGNAPLEETMYATMMRLGPPCFDAADKEFAAEIQKSLRHEDIVTAYGRFGLKPKSAETLSEEIYPLGSGVNSLVGSTDVGTVSWVVPTVQCRVACYAIGTPGHSWQLVAQGLAPAAHKGLAYAAKTMAGTAVAVLSDEVLLARAKAEHKAFRAQNPFANPIAEDLAVPLDMAAH